MKSIFSLIDDICIDFVIVELFHVFLHEIALILIFQVFRKEKWNVFIARISRHEEWRFGVFDAFEDVTASDIVQVDATKFIFWRWSIESQPENVDTSEEVHDALEECRWSRWLVGLEDFSEDFR